MKIINHEYYASPKVAKLLKEAGFDWEVNHCYSSCDSLDNSCSGYMEDLRFYHNINDGKYGGTSAPTLDVTQRWLREVKNFIVESRYCTTIDRKFRYRVTLYDEHGNYKYGIDLRGMSDTYEQALEAGIQKALELILEKGE